MYVIDWFRHEPIFLWEYAVIAVLILLFGPVMAVIGFVQLGLKAGDAMFRNTWAITVHSYAGAGYKLSIFTLGEDAVYRFVALSLAVHFLQNEWLTLLVAAISSAIFGFMPPHTEVPVRTRIAVCFGGFALCLLYLKCGGWHGRFPVKPFLFTGLAHLWATGLIAYAWRYSRRPAP